MRRYCPSDKEVIIKLIDVIYHEYGDAIYLEDCDSDLLDIEANYLTNGEFWVATHDKNSSQVIGCIAVTLSQ